MAQNDPWGSLFADWVRHGCKIPEDATPEERMAWKGLRDVERFRSEVAALGEFDNIERKLYRGLEPWQYHFAIGGELEVERIVFEFLEARRSGVEMHVWPSEVQVEAMRRGLVEIDRLAVRGELESYRRELRSRLERTLSFSEIEGNTGWITAQARAMRNLNQGNDQVKAETDLVARLAFGYRPSKIGDPARTWSFSKEKRPQMDLLSEYIPAFSPPRGKNHKTLTLTWAGEQTIALLDAMRSKVLGAGMSRKAAAKEVAGELAYPRNPEYYKTILNHFRQRMRLRW